VVATTWARTFVLGGAAEPASVTLALEPLA
jgi:hypothetical protein